MAIDDEPRRPRIVSVGPVTASGGPSADLDAAAMALNLAVAAGASCTLTAAQAFAITGWIDVLESVVRGHDVDEG